MRAAYSSPITHGGSFVGRILFALLWFAAVNGLAWGLLLELPAFPLWKTYTMSSASFPIAYFVGYRWLIPLGGASASRRDAEASPQVAGPWRYIASATVTLLIAMSTTLGGLALGNYLVGTPRGMNLQQEVVGGLVLTLAAGFLGGIGTLFFEWRNAVNKRKAAPN